MSLETKSSILDSESTDTLEKRDIKIITYIRRNRNLTREQFYKHWSGRHAYMVIPFAEKHGFKQYQQVYCSGTIVPMDPTFRGPKVTPQPNLSTEPVEFDGIIMFVVSSLEQFIEAFQDPYYINVIEPDEHKLLDKNGPGHGFLASFSGEMTTMVNGNKSTLGEEGCQFREIYDQWQKRVDNSTS